MSNWTKLDLTINGKVLVTGEFQYFDMGFLINKIQFSRNELLRKGYLVTSLKIAMPKYLLKLLECHFESEFPFGGESLLCGMQIISNYQNNIVVFSEDSLANVEDDFIVIDIFK